MPKINLKKLEQRLIGEGIALLFNEGFDDQAKAIMKLQKIFKNLKVEKLTIKEGKILCKRST